MYTQFIRAASIFMEILFGFDILHTKAFFNKLKKTLNVDGIMLPLMFENDCRKL